MSRKEAFLSTSVDIKIPFHDCDPMQVVWHGNYARYFEVARCKLLEMLDFGYRNMEKAGYIWPIVDMRVKFINPVVFDQTITVKAVLTEYESRLKIDYFIYDAKTQQKLTKGSTIQVAVSLQSNEMQFVTPEAFTQKLEAFWAK